MKDKGNKELADKFQKALVEQFAKRLKEEGDTPIQILKDLMDHGQFYYSVIEFDLREGSDVVLGMNGVDFKRRIEKAIKKEEK